MEDRTKEGIVRMYSAPLWSLDASQPSIKVQAVAPTRWPDSAAHAPAGSVSIGRGDRVVYVKYAGSGRSAIQDGRNKAAAMLRKWRHEGRKIQRSRMIGSHCIGTFIPADAPGWPNRNWKR